MPGIRRTVKMRRSAGVHGDEVKQGAEWDHLRREEAGRIERETRSRHQQDQSDRDASRDRQRNPERDSSAAVQQGLVLRRRLEVFLCCVSRILVLAKPAGLFIFVL